MDNESPSPEQKQSWIAEHPLMVIGIILALCLGPFAGKAIHVDDMVFVWEGQWIQRHPINFYGFELTTDNFTIPMWRFHVGPPLMSYFLAGVGSLFGWHEIALHLACLLVAVVAAWGIYALARMWCDQPLLATTIAIFTPVFLVSSTTLMCDVLMLMFWTWALVFWERALTSPNKSPWQFLGAGALAGLAALTKYSAGPLLPLLPILAILRTRKLGWWLAGLAVPLMMVAGYEWMTARMYGTSLLFSSTHNIHTIQRVEFPGGWKANGIVNLAFAGGCLLPLFFFTPWLWRRRVLLAGGAVISGLLLGTFCLGGDLGLLLPWENPELMNHWSFVLQVMLLTAAGLHLFLLVGAEAGQCRNIISLTLVLWVASGLLIPALPDWGLCARRFLPVVPAAAILLVRRLDAIRGKSLTGCWWLWPLIPAAVITLSVAMADYRLANSTRTAAQEIAAKYKSTGSQVWFEGGYGTFQYYMQAFGSQPLDVERSLFQKGDVVVVPWLNSAFKVLPPGSVGWVETLEYEPHWWMNSYGNAGSETAGFYGAVTGPVPFVIGGLPRQIYFVVRMFSAVQFNTQPANRKEVQAGDAPCFTNTSALVKNKLVFPMNPEVTKQVRLASQLEASGKTAEAIKQYRNALNLDSNNPVVLNNLAWILAASSKPELRNGFEAVQLASRAVELTDRRLPLFIGTLGAAFAESGRFEEAANTGNVALHLAQLTGQQDVADKNARLLVLYASGKTAAETDP